MDTWFNDGYVFWTQLFPVSWNKSKFKCKVFPAEAAGECTATQTNTLNGHNKLEFSLHMHHPPHLQLIVTVLFGSVCYKWGSGTRCKQDSRLGSRWMRHRKNLSSTKDKSSAKQVVQKTQHRDGEQPERRRQEESGKAQQSCQRHFYWGQLQRRCSSGNWPLGKGRKKN